MAEQNQRTCRLGRRPAKQGPRPQSGNRDWVDKSATGINRDVKEKLKVAAKEFVVGTWNVQTLWSTGKLELLRQEMSRYKHDILGLSEMRWTMAGELNGAEVIWSGEEKEHVRGVGFLLSKRAREALMGYNPVCSRIITARFRGSPMNVSIIQVYAPTADSLDEEIETFYNKLEETWEDLPRKDVKVVMGDWNAKVGQDNAGWEHAMGRYGYGERNERGERLLEFASAHDLFICNTRFEQKASRKWTWRSPDGQHHNMIDLVLVEKRWKSSIRNCRTYQGADIASDHSLVLCHIKLRLKQRKRRNQRTQRLNVKALKDSKVRQAYRAELEKCLENKVNIEGIDEQASWLTVCISKAAEATLPKSHKPNKPWISEKTLELAGRKRQMRQKRNESDEMETKYRKLCNEVRKSARQDKDTWLLEQCRSIEKGMNTSKSREAYKLIKTITRKWQPRQSMVKDRNGKMLQDKDAVRKRWTEYCSELYTDSEPGSSVVEELELISPPLTNDKDDSILYEEVERAIKRLKNNKSAGSDGITGEMINVDSEKLTEELHRLCNEVWKEERIPGEWTRAVLVTIPKKGDQAECGNYRTIALLSHLSKVLLMILLERLEQQIENHLAEEQAGFRRDRSTIQQILNLRLIAEKARRKGKLVYNCFIDFQKAFDSVKQEIIWATLKSYGIGQTLISILKYIGEHATAAVRVGTELGEWFKTTIGTRQGDPVSPKIFISYLDRVMDRVKESESGVRVSGTKINNLRFADDIDMIDWTSESLQQNIDIIKSEGEKAGLKINVGKTKTMVFGKREIEVPMKVGTEAIENVDEFVYLGSTLTWNNDCSVEINKRIAKATGVMAAFNNIWKSNAVSNSTKLAIIRTFVWSVFLYACETWTLKKKDEQRIQAFEMKCYRRMLRITWHQKIRNTEIRKTLGIDRTLLQTVMQRKLEMFGHICRMKDDRMIKQVVFGRMHGKSVRGRPHREWLDDVISWSNLKMNQLIEAAKDRKKWRQVINEALDTNGRKPMD